MVRISAMVGTMMLARAVDDPALAKAMREAALQYFPRRTAKTVRPAAAVWPFFLNNDMTIIIF